MGHRIFVCIPAFGYRLTATTFMATHALMPVLASKGIGGAITVLSYPDIAELRDMFLTMFYDVTKDFSHLLMIDADIGFPAEMVLDMLMLDEPIVGTIYPQRKFPLGWAGSGDGTLQAQRIGNFMKVEGTGMGVSLIRRDLVTRLLEQMPELSDDLIHMHPSGEILKQAGANRLIRAFDKLHVEGRGWLSEDLSFCKRWQQCGGTTWAAIGYRISHVGDFDYAGRYLDMIEQMEAQAALAAAAPPVDTVTPIPVNETPPAQADVGGQIVPVAAPIEQSTEDVSPMAAVMAGVLPGETVVQQAAE